MKTKLIFIILTFALVGMFVTFKILSMINYLLIALTLLYVAYRMITVMRLRRKTPV